MTQGRQREGQENSSSSGPSSHGSGGEPMSEGPEDSPSAAHVSVQTESSVSLTASTDLRSYLNTSLDNSLDTSISASHDTWHQSSLLVSHDLFYISSPYSSAHVYLWVLSYSGLHPQLAVKDPGTRELICCYGLHPWKGQKLTSENLDKCRVSIPDDLNYMC